MQFAGYSLELGLESLDLPPDLDAQLDVVTLSFHALDEHVFFLLVQNRCRAYVTHLQVLQEGRAAFLQGGSVDAFERVAL